uniref:hypothetical protein n=1 Tax=Salmonella enterica TaxID=28901 RepID=UPI001C37BD4A
KHSAQPRKVGNFWILGIKKTSVEVHLYAFGAKAGLAFRFNVLKIDGFLEFTLGFAPRMGHKIECWVEDHKVGSLFSINGAHMISKYISSVTINNKSAVKVTLRQECPPVL